MILAHVGDSRAVLCKQGLAVGTSGHSYHVCAVVKSRIRCFIPGVVRLHWELYNSIVCLYRFILGNGIDRVPINQPVAL